MFQVTMLLAQAPGQPNGSVDDRLVLTLALTRFGEIDLAAYQADPSPWLAIRQTPQGTRTSELIRTDDSWALRGHHDDDQPLLGITARLFRPGEYVSVHAQSSGELIYRIVAVEAEVQTVR
jgi:hypothetical protein